MIPNLALDAAKVIERQVAKLDRVPFRRMLAELVGVKPTQKALQEFADKHPDRWAQAISIAAGLAGYEKGINVNVNLHAVEHLSDVQLIARLRELEERLRRREFPVEGAEDVEPSGADRGAQPPRLGDSDG